MSVLLLHPDDNILVAAAPLASGARVTIDGASFAVADAIDVGHKLARRPLAPGERVLKYGAPIGSMTAAAEAGDHVHLHNMKSDYIASHTRDALERSNNP